MAPPEIVETEQRCSFSKLQEERIASRCIKPNVVTAKAVHVIEKEALGARDHHGTISPPSLIELGCVVCLVTVPHELQVSAHLPRCTWSTFHEGID